MHPAPAAQYSRDWTSHHFQDWERWLGHLAGRPAYGLEIGSFEGRSSRWFMEHILTDTASHLLCIDPYDYGDEHALVPGGGTYIDKQFDFAAVRRMFERNLSQWLNVRLTLDARPSRHALRSLAAIHQYDFAFIDGSHVASAVLEDSILVWPLIRPGGVVIWDDYDWDQSRPGPWGDVEVMRPRLAVDAFLRVFAGRYEAREHSNCQMMVRKRT
jgi:hypothetical protein